MVESKIIKLYSFVWEPILSDGLTGHDIIEFAKNLPQLRNALSCCVCNQLLTNREILSPSKCREHFVCKGCRGKDRKDDKKCELCKDWDTFEEDETLKVIVKSYQDFCFYFLTHEDIVHLLEVKHEVDPSFDTFKLIDLVAEGCKGSSLHKQRQVALERGNRGVVAHTISNRKSKKIVGPVVKTNPLAPPNTTSGNDKVPDGRNKNTSQISAEKGSKCTTPVLEKALPMPRKVYSPSPPKPAASAPEQLIMVSPIVSGSTTPTTAGNIPTTSPTIFKIKVEPGFQGAARNLTDKFVNVGNEKDTRKLPPSSRQALSQDHMDLPVPGPSQSPLRGNFPTTIAISSSSGPFNVNSLPIKLTPSLLPSASQGTTHIYQITHPGGMITRALSIRPQQLRLASNVTFQQRGGVPVRVFGGSVTSEGIRVSTSPVTNTQMSSAFTNAIPRRKIIVTTTTNSDLQQRWPDPTKVLQFATGDLSRLPGFATSTLRPSVVSVGGAAGPGSTRFPSMNIRPVMSGPLVRPINPTSSVSMSMGSSGTCVPTSLVANRISEPSLPQSLAMQCSSSPVSTGVGTMIRSEVATSSAHMPVPVSTSNSTASVATSKRKQEGCRCGNATPNPGKLTCIGQRCACYADGNACSDCKCKGCKNPYLPGSGGKKLLHGVRALLDPQTNQTVPIVGSVNTGPSTSAVLNSPTVTSSNIPSAASTVGSTSFGHIPGPSSHVSHPTPPIQLIPVRFGQSGTAQYIQITNAHALQQIPIILSGGHLQASSAGGITIQGVPVSSLASGIHQVAHIQQQRPTQINIKSERTSHDGT